MPNDLTPAQREFYEILDRSARLCRELDRVLGPWFGEDIRRGLECEPPRTRKEEWGQMWK